MQGMMNNMAQAQLEEQAMMSEGEPDMNDEELAAYLQQLEQQSGEELAYADGESVVIAETDTTNNEHAIAAAEAAVE